MNILRRKIRLTRFFTNTILFYLVMITSPNCIKKENNNLYYVSNNLHSIYSKSSYGQKIDLTNLEEKLISDLSKYNILGLIDADTPVNITLDLEGRIIGYRSSIPKMPSYWTSDVTKRLLIKNNSFSLSYKKDQVISFRLLPSS